MQYASRIAAKTATTTAIQHAACSVQAWMELFKERQIWLIAILIAVLHAAMAVTAVNTKSPTFDEPQHLTAGYSYWVTNDFRLDPENGNLPARWAALPLLLSDTKFVPLNDRGWQRADEGRTGHQFFYETGNDSDRMLGQARMMMSIFGAALCILIYRCAREFFGVLGGLLAESIAAFDPNFLANSGLVASDIAATFFFTAAVWSSWCLCQRISLATLAITALSLSGLFLTKFSAPIVLPVVSIVSILQIFSLREIEIQLVRFRTAFADKWKKACAVGASWTILGATVFFAIWLAFSFRYSAWTNNESTHEGTTWNWNYLLKDHGPFENAVAFTRVHHLLPEAYLYGLAYVHKHEIDRPAFLDNQWSIVGFYSFFPRAFLYKTTLPSLCLLALALYAAILRSNGDRIPSPRDLWKIANLFNPLWAVALVYSAFAVTSRLNIGHRHILPIYPALFIGCGAVAHLLHKNRRAIFTAGVAILLFWQIGESFAIRPNYLAYFNEVAGGPARGYNHLVDSSLDWGQDLPALKTWLDEHGAIVDGKSLYLAYFGTADPRWYDIDANLLSPEKRLSGDRSFALTGGVYCVSATTVQSVYALEIGPWCVPYEQHYRNALAEMERYHNSAAATTARVALISSDATSPSPSTIREFERLRFERLCAYLRHRSPIAQIGYSIFVFDLNNDEINRALYGPPAELRQDVSVTGF
ncbi:MAG: glycosyltransferase family 39 protein [Verrucomicrobiota bacterium]|nr:glycosyltransferase family 39 protein [Verrucomicrobiota bacterium]